MAFPSSFLDELRARVPLVPVISRKVKLTKAGREWKGCCPFHNEKTPSFYVNEDKGFYHCFGCAAHGDVIRFVVEQEGLRFPDAVRQLAAEAGLAVPEETPEAKARQEQQAGLHDIMARAAGWFTDQLNGLAGANARRYIEQRGLSAETVKRFGLGFAPDGNKLKSALKDVGEGKLTETGLIGHAEERDDSYDRFRSRLMFPIRDPRGRVVGFGGRVIGEGQPKYLNSPETVLFDKGRLLYNLDKAGPLARKSGRLFVVEGYMDVIGLAEAGIEEAVAPNGTALTETQIQLLWRVVPEPILCFDGDSAGQNAAIRAAKRALPLLQPGVSLRILRLPPGQDPDDMMRSRGPEAFLELAAKAEPLHDFLWHSLLSSADTTTPERRAGFKAELQELANEITNRDIKAQYELIFRERFWSLFGWSRTSGAPRPVFQRGVLPRPNPVKHEAHAALAGLIEFPDIAVSHAEEVAGMPAPDKHLIRLRNAILDALAWEPSLDTTALRHTLSAQGLNDLVNQVLETRKLHFSFNSAGSDAVRARKMLVELIRALGEIYDILVRYQTIKQAVRSECDPAAGVALMDELRELEAEHRGIMSRLYDFNQEFGVDPEIRAWSPKQTDRMDETNGEDERRDDGRHGYEGSGRHAAA